MKVIVVYAATAGAALGYSLRCWRPGQRLRRWAEHQVPGSLPWRCAQPILAATLASAWAIHPIRSLNNLRSWRQGPQDARELEFNPNWAAERLNRTG